MIKPPSNPDNMNLQDLKTFNNAGSFFEDIQISDDIEIEKYLMSSENHLWILSDNIDNLFSRFSDDPFDDIKELYLKKFNIDITYHPIHFILFSNISVAEKFIGGKTRLPLIFETCEGISDKPIFLDFINI